jgi:hypothetical protein
MKKLLYAASLLTILFTGCFDDDDPVSSSSISATSKVVAQAPTTFPEDMKNVLITFNPTIEILSDTEATYVNIDKESAYPYVPDVIDINISITDAGNMLGFTTTIDGKELELGFKFIDIGGKGYIDYAELSVVKLDGEDQTFNPSEKIVFVKLERNTNVAESDLLDFNTTAPTSAEWNRYVVGTSVVLTDSTEAGSVSLAYFSSSTSGVLYDNEIASLLESNVSEGIDFTYTYEQGENNQGLVKISSDVTNPNDEQTYTYKSDITLTFSTLVAATWEENAKLYDPSGNNVTSDTLGADWDGSGDVQIMYDLDDAKKLNGLE